MRFLPVLSAHRKFSTNGLGGDLLEAGCWPASLRVRPGAYLPLSPQFGNNGQGIRKKASLSCSRSVFIAFIVCGCIVEPRAFLYATVLARTIRECPLDQCSLEFPLHYWHSFWPGCCHYMVKIRHRVLTLRDRSQPIGRQLRTPALSSRAAACRRRTASLNPAARDRASQTGRRA